MCRSTTRNLMWQLRLRSLNLLTIVLRAEIGKPSRSSEFWRRCCLESDCKPASSDLLFARYHPWVDENIEVSKSPCLRVPLTETRDFYLPQAITFTNEAGPGLLKRSSSYLCSQAGMV